MEEDGKRRLSPTAENGVELRLGLSTNGRFGSDHVPKRLKPSGSVSMPLLSGYSPFDNAPINYQEARASSALPARAALSGTPETGDVETQTRQRTGKYNDDGGSSGGVSSSQGSAGGSSDLHKIPSEGTVDVERVENRTIIKSELDEIKRALAKMPYVSTRSYDPTRTKTEGFLYRYKSSNDLQIMCVCHGKLMTPHEFVKHGGGDEVAAAQPLKNILITRVPFL